MAVASRRAASSALTPQGVNELRLQAELIERGAVRYTPAGLPALDLSLKHESQVLEDSQVRKVSMEIKAVAIGEITHALGGLPLGSHGVFTGFLAGSPNNRSTQFHITAFNLLPIE